MKNKAKKTALILSLAGFLLITSGVTYGLFKFVQEGTSTNIITSGSITFHYQELDGKGHGISITDAMPVSSNQTAKGMNKAFNFDITSKTFDKYEIPYTITARLDQGSSEILGNIVDLYLTEVNGASENATPLFAGSTLPTYSDLEQYSKVSNYVEKVIYEGKVPANTASYKKNFRLRMWIDENANFAEQCSVSPKTNDTEEKCSAASGTWAQQYNGKEFSVTINVNAEGKAQAATPSTRRLAKAIVDEEDDDDDDDDNEEVIPRPTPTPDPNPGVVDCDETTDPTCHTCDPSTDLSCGSNGKKQDKCANGICETTDDDDGDGENEDIIYYKGTDVDNYVRFGSDQTLWRIVRINGDGTIRMVRTAAIDSAATYAYNNSTTSQAALYYTNSLVKQKLNKWYDTNIVANDLDQYVASGKYFCQDIDTSVADATYNCTSAGLVNGKIGLVTLSEFVKTGYQFFEFDGPITSFWTMTPKQFISGSNVALVWEVANGNNTMSVGSVPANTDSFVAYPVINLKANTKVTGTGKKTDPYVVVLKQNIELTGLAKLVYDTNVTNNTYFANSSSLSYKNSSNNLSETPGLYKTTETNTGRPTYFFRGNLDYNNVKFRKDSAGNDLLWKIIRINEDGTVRMIMQQSMNDGATYRISNVSSTNSDVYDENYKWKPSVMEFLYYTNGTMAKPAIDSWFNETFNKTIDVNSTVKYKDFVAKGTYCEQLKAVFPDYSTDPNYYSGGLVEGETYRYDEYVSDYRCSVGTWGHGPFRAYAGLISLDELLHAGAYFQENNNEFYLKDIGWNLTSSPSGANGMYPNTWESLANNIIVSQTTTSSGRIHPVINIKGSAPASGTGTTEDPYVIIME